MVFVAEAVRIKQRTLFVRFCLQSSWLWHGDRCRGKCQRWRSHNLMTFSCHLHVSTFNSSVLLFYCVDVKPIFIVQSIWTRDTDAYKGIINKITIFVLFLFHDRECPSSALECTFCSIIDGNNSSNDDDNEDSISRNSNWIHSQRCNNHNAFVGQSPVEERQKRRNNCRISSFRWMNCSRTGFCLVAVHEKWNTRRTKENQMENSKFYRSVSVQLAFVLIAMSPLLRSLNERLVIRDQGAHKRSIKSDRTKRNRRTAADVINYNFIIAIMATATMKTTMAEAGDAEVLHLRIEKKERKKKTHEKWIHIEPTGTNGLTKCKRIQRARKKIGLNSGWLMQLWPAAAVASRQSKSRKNFRRKLNAYAFAFAQNADRFGNWHLIELRYH